MIGSIMRIQVLKNSHITSSVMICLALLLAILSLPHSVRAQSLDAMMLHKILMASDSARSSLSYTGIVEIQPEFRHPQPLQIRIWAQGKNLYFQQPLSPPPDRPMMPRQRMERNFRRHHRLLRPMPFGAENNDFGFMLDQKYLTLFLRNYQVEYHPSDLIAGRATNLLIIKPNFLPRFGMRLWLDQQNFLVLKREISYFKPNEEKLTLRFQFREIQFDVSPPDSILELANQEELPRKEFDWLPAKMTFTDLQELKNQIHTEVFEPKIIPPGCELISIRVVQERRRDVIQLHYTDGLLNFSIFQFYGAPPHVIKNILQQQPPRNPLPRFQQIIAKQKGDYSFLLIGNFPSEQLDQIAESLTEF